MINRADVIYTENKAKLLWSIEPDLVFHEN